MSWYLGPIEAGFSESLKGFSMELHLAKNDLRFSCGKIFGITRKTKMNKAKFMTDTSEFD